MSDDYDIEITRREFAGAAGLAMAGLAGCLDGSDKQYETPDNGSTGEPTTEGPATEDPTSTEPTTTSDGAGLEYQTGDVIRIGQLSATGELAEEYGEVYKTVSLEGEHNGQEYDVEMHCDGVPSVNRGSEGDPFTQLDLYGGDEAYESEHRRLGIKIYEGDTIADAVDLPLWEEAKALPRATATEIKLGANRGIGTQPGLIQLEFDTDVRYAYQEE
ncbi:MAG: hypothetical protein SV186_01165 [Candidatus Nanohaloarchaea archaeon]|nr:hypothetical protein [Candidatus Nanohaloarchaea archaeon]